MAEKMKPEDRPRDRTAIAVILLVIGVLALLTNLTQSSLLGLMILPALGLLFLFIGIFTQRFGFVIPGGILSGLGIATFLSVEVLKSEGQAAGGVVVLGLALGFLIIPLVGHLMNQSRWDHLWAMFPGVILGMIGLALFAGDAGLGLLAFLGNVWPIILLAVGAYLLLWPRKRLQ
jgi:hypothetical protein